MDPAGVMQLEGKKLALLIAAGPDSPNFRHALNLAEAALERQVEVYLYCIDEAVAGITQPRLQALKEEGLRLFACAYGAQRRDLPLSEEATFAGLGVLSELIAKTDRFLIFS